MKIKKIVIKSRADFEQETLLAARRIDRGERPKGVPKIIKGEYFESLEAVRCFLTERRLELWRVIRDQEPRSLTELAHFVHRDYKDVHQDVTILVEVGLVDLKKPKGSKTRAVKPVSIADQLEFKVA